MMQFLNDNPMLLTALIIFLVFVVIGFIGDSYLRKQGKIGSLIPKGKKEKPQEPTNEETLETSEELITSENVNQIENDSSITTKTSSEDILPDSSVEATMDEALNTMEPDNTSTDGQDTVQSEVQDSVQTEEQNLNETNGTLQPTEGIMEQPIENNDVQNEELYPQENTITEQVNKPQAFDGTISGDENIDNVF